MSFFDRNRQELTERGFSPHRLPPGQYFTERFPVLQVEEVPRYKSLSDWDLRIFGEVSREIVLSYQDLMELEQTELIADIHCVTKWSKFDTRWRGVSFSSIVELVSPLCGASSVMFHGDPSYTTNIPLEDLTNSDGIIATHYADAPLDPEHGYPARFVFPGLYFWKSTKWLRKMEFMAEDAPGFWEKRGYHIYGDPWKEQRYDQDL